MKTIIIDGVTAGMSAVSKVTGGSRAEVVVYEEGTICSCGTRGFPYYLANRGTSIRQAVAAVEEMLRTSSVTAHCCHGVPSVACDRKQVTTGDLDDGQVFDDHYDKLVIAAGLRNLIPDVPGAEKAGVQVLKTVEDVVLLRELTKIPFARDITITGGSFAGLELAKAFLKTGRSVRIIEKEDQLLPIFDGEVSVMIQRELEESDVKIHLRETLRGFTGGTFTEKTETNHGSYDTDLAMIVVGVAPNTGCLTGSGISMTSQGEIITNKFMEVNVPDVYAVGDYARSLEGSLRTFSLKMADLEIAKTGLTEQEAKKQGSMGSRVKIILVTANDRPELCPDINQITVKMVYDGTSGRVLDAQTQGKKNMIARVNMLAVTIESDMTLEQLGNVDFSYPSVAFSIWNPVQVICRDARQAGGNHMEKVDAVGLSFFGKGTIRQLPTELEKMGIRRVLVATDQSPHETGMMKQVGRVLPEGSTEYAIYCQVQLNPTVQVINECLTTTRTLEVDTLVAVGGGSAIDTVEAVNVVMTNSGSVEDYEGAGKSVRPGIPIVAINTTADTDSEVTSPYIVADTEKHSKMAMMDTSCMVWVAVNDIGFMMNTLPKLTASTGMDALAHVLEAVLSVRATPSTNKGALWAIGTICENLPKTVSDGNDEEARAMMAYTKYATGMAFFNMGLGMVHAMTRTLGERYNLSHGACSVVSLPYVLEYNGVAPGARIRFEKIVKVMRLEAAAGQTMATYGSSPSAQTISTMIEAVRQLLRQVGIPQNLSLLEPVKTGDFHILVKFATKDTCMAGNAVRPTLQEVTQVYHHAYQGGWYRKHRIITPCQNSGEGWLFWHTNTCRLSTRLL